MIQTRRPRATGGTWACVVMPLPNTRNSSKPQAHPLTLAHVWRLTTTDLIFGQITFQVGRVLMKQQIADDGTKD